MKRLGVLGTLVWDRIHHCGAEHGAEPVEGWGGIAYSLAALAASAPPGWEIVPILKIGEDLRTEADVFLRGVPGLSPGSSVRVVPEPNNRVELRYLDDARRRERLTGGVSPWSWAELMPLVGELDALYINFISGFELGLPDARQLRAGFPGPIYADLHSLLLGRAPDGHRTLRPLEAWREWFRCFDAIQVNEDELNTLAVARRDPWRFAAEAVGKGAMLVVVTLGARGAAYVAGPDLPADPLGWPEHRRTLASTAPLRSVHIPPPSGRVSGDPTGCGDVWGGTFVAGLLSGDSLDSAVRRAHDAATRNVSFQGASGLYAHLRGGSATVGH